MDRKYKNINGWLFAVQIFLIVKAFIWIRNVQLYLGILDKKDEMLTSMGITEPGLYNIFVYYEVVTSFLCLSFYIIMVYYMFKRSRLFPKLTYIFLVSEFIINIISTTIFIQILPIEASIMWNLIVNFVIAVIILIYLKYSERVKLTFIV